MTTAAGSNAQKNYGVVTLVSHIALEEIEETFSVAFSSVFLCQPQFMKLDEILFSSEKPLQYLLILFVSCVSFSVLLSVGFVPNCMADDLVFLSEYDKIEVFAVEITFQLFKLSLPVYCSIFRKYALNSSKLQPSTNPTASGSSQI